MAEEELGCSLRNSVRVGRLLHVLLSGQLLSCPYLAQDLGSIFIRHSLFQMIRL